MFANARQAPALSDSIRSPAPRSSTLKAKNLYVYFNHSLSEGVETLQKTLGALSNDSQLGDPARRCLKRDDFFENDSVKPYLERKKRKIEEKIGVEVTLHMANKILGIAKEIAYQKSLDCLKKWQRKKIRVDGLDDTEEFENVWVELKGGVGTRHESENSNNREDLDVLLKGFSVMSAVQALTMPRRSKEEDL
ncbi:2987_t:CDS:2 [Paraglomus occultum]|uniref:2987_t:CDS:1 n=1 Tax=Paraglomus occultum TaxID=144539 RepID=A0A9N9ACN3_9GLOM|nr:2987_t:CDS:2 [Paraglomus occultum]